MYDGHLYGYIWAIVPWHDTVIRGIYDFNSVIPSGLNVEKRTEQQRNMVWSSVQLILINSFVVSPNEKWANAQIWPPAFHLIWASLESIFDRYSLSCRNKMLISTVTFKYAPCTKYEREIIHYKRELTELVKFFFVVVISLTFTPMCCVRPPSTISILFVISLHALRITYGYNRSEQLSFE